MTDLALHPRNDVWMQRTSTFLMFVGDQCGNAREAVTFYTSLFDDGDIESMDLIDPSEVDGREGLVRYCKFSMAGAHYMASDSPAQHEFSFTPSISIAVECDSVEAADRLFGQLSDCGQILMPLDDYGFSARFGWTADRFGVSWQISADWPK